MSTLTPTPVVLQDLLTAGADINLFNDGVKTQLVSPRTKGWEPITVQVVDDPLSPNVSAGTADGTTASKLVDSTADFVTDAVEVGDAVINTTDLTYALVTAVDSLTTLSLDTDIFIATETYRIIKPSFWTQRDATGEWCKDDVKTGNNVRATYNLPTPGTASTVVVNSVVVPVAAPENTGNYPPAANY